MAAFEIVFAITPEGTHFDVISPDCPTADEQARCDQLLEAAGLSVGVWRDRLMTTHGVWWEDPYLVGREAVASWGPDVMEPLASYEAWYQWKQGRRMG